MDREPTQPRDLSLLGLERMRILDLANSWSARTHQGYRSRIKAIKGFERLHPGLEILAKAQIQGPPRDKAIPLCWLECYQSTKNSPVQGRDKMSYNTIRLLCSAAGWSDTVTMLVSNPGSLMFEGKG